MRATRQSLQAQPKILKKSSKHQINQSERKFSQKNCVSYLKSVKEQKIRIGATRQNLQAPSKILKKSSKHQIKQLEQNFSQKNFV
jgi:translation initiation factor RLI1